MSQQERAEIVYHPLSGRYSPEKVRSLREALGGIPAKDFSDREKEPWRGQVPKVWVLYGGDGLVQRALSWIGQHGDPQGEPPSLVVSAGGTGNTLERMLREAGMTVSSEQLKEGIFPDLPTIRPGEIKSTSGNTPFGSVAAVGSFGQGWARWMEIVRPARLSPDVKLNLAGIGGLLSSLARNSEQEEFRLDAFTVGPNLGLFPASDQKLTGEDLTRVTIDGWKRLVLSLFLWRLGRQPWANLVSVERGPSFQTKNSTTVNIDGRNFSLPTGEQMTFQRNEQAYRMAALVLS